MYLVDTNLIIWVLRGDKRYEDLLQRWKYKGSLSVSAIAIAEIYKNVYPAELAKTEAILDQFEVWDVTSEIAKQAGFYWQQYSKRYKSLHIFDSIIAATAKVHKLTLFTLNIRHFPMDDIKVIDPLKS